MTENYEVVGPFDEYAVTIDGRKVPFLQAHPQAGGKLLLTLDDRAGLEIDVQAAGSIIPFVANCIAVGMGYTCHGGIERSPFPKLSPLPDLEDGDHAQREDA